MKEICYEPHPVTPERKAELVSQGYKIIDERFKPADEQPEEQPEEQPKRTRKARGE